MTRRDRIETFVYGKPLREFTLLEYAQTTRRILLHTLAFAILEFIALVWMIVTR